MNALDETLTDYLADEFAVELVAEEDEVLGDWLQAGEDCLAGVTDHVEIRLKWRRAWNANVQALKLLQQLREPLTMCGYHVDMLRMLVSRLSSN